MKKVFLGVALIGAMCFSAGVNAQDAKTKKEAPKTETTKNEAACCSANAKADAKMCCSATAQADAKTCCSSTAQADAKTCCSAGEKKEAKTCCNATAQAEAKPCCSQQSANVKSNEKKECCQVEKIIAEKKTEVKKK